MAVLIGTSGWQYRQWRGRFYPPGLPQRLWLEHYAERFATVEVNATFYRLPGPETAAAWARRVPAGFVFTVKASRYLSHIRRLRDPAQPVARLMEVAGRLGDRLGPVLVQLPPGMRRDAGLLDAALAEFPPGVRVAFEPRDDSWSHAETWRVLERHDAALAMADRHSRPVTAVRRTATWGYLRLHEGRAAPHPCYGVGALDGWARRLAGLFGPDDDVFVYFNNDGAGCAPRDARLLAPRLERLGLPPTRVPGARETPLVGA
ncbi:DUF72 domain-containing protein [Miltoncostaea marina]|uniref:DUF72 domain-containing protein n=1 Tax=Miltoncostaea marina TaxID=2843215 RepID=UPI001C3E83D6|nr:DUF72 domain-containing protein [Miltoncostaea marina]